MRIEREDRISCASREKIFLSFRVTKRWGRVCYRHVGTGLWKSTCVVTQDCQQV